MKVEQWIRVIAGSLVFTTALLGFLVDRNWLWVTMFVGLNLFQFGFSNKCPLTWLLKRLGVQE